MANETMQLAEIQRLARTEAPGLADLLRQYLEQGDPDPFEETVQQTDEDGETKEVQVRKEPPENWISFSDHSNLLERARARHSRQARQQQIQEAWQKFLAQDPSLLPPRFQLAELLDALHQQGTATARALLIEICQDVPLRYGVWGGLKRIYKKAEASLDAELFGVLAARFDQGATSPAYDRDVSGETLGYLRRRAWRFLRQLGASVPEMYPRFAAEVLRNYPSSADIHGLWVMNHIVGHGTKHYDLRSFSGRLPPEDMVKHRAFPESWKRSPDELMFLLDACRHDVVARFAIQGLQKDFPERLRSVSTAWLARLPYRKLDSIDAFVVETLSGSPELHQGKLRGLGLHDAVLELLGSSNKVAYKYAAEYARAHARDMEKERLFRLLSSDHKELVELAQSLLTARPPRELGHAFIAELLSPKVTREWATKALSESFERSELPREFLVDMLYGEEEQRDWAKKYIEKKYPGTEIGAPFWTQVLDDKRAEEESDTVEVAFKFLGKYKAADIGVDWLVDALTRDWLNGEASALLQKATHLPGLNIERLKGMVFNPSLRTDALAILGNPKLVSSKELGLPWLLALAKRPDTDLHEFAHRYLLEHMKPADFAEGDAQAGASRLFGLALGEQEPVRAFAQTYLLCHHPALGPEQPRSKQFGLKPVLKEKDYDPQKIWGLLRDERADVRAFALQLVRPNLRAWNLHTRVYELADLEPKEVRTLAYAALEGAGNELADPQVALKLEELDAAPIFQMTESTKRATRDVAMGLIRRHYTRLGGAERLGWLMQSADREVRLFSVRLLWEKHRPRSYPQGWKPRKAADVPLTDEGRFEDVEALRGLLRRLLFGLPPGRSPAGDSETKRRHVSASVIKKNIVELVRDLGAEDAAFAALVAPVLQEFSGSLARGEWQSCLAALTHLHRAHPGLAILRT
ncbi:MAG: hypothetical protein MUF64_03950 [Polyangiaceae bacterium]|jgi:hypothetical protein|nr:hypothetical protein [Polyangiaceae bacterium]